MREFKVGFAKVDITPELGCLLYGYPRERRAQRVMDPLSVGAAAFKQGEKTVLLMNTELCAFNVETCAEIREAVGKEVSVDKDNIVYSVTHTHSGPVTHTSVGWGETDMSYINDILIPASIEAAKKAVASMQDAVMGFGSADCMAGINRREIDPDGNVILGQNPDGAYDPTMVVMSFKNLDGKNIGSMVFFATHPTVAGSNFSLTRDWPGVMIDRVEESTGAPCIYINGAEGNVGPRLSNGLTTGDEEDVAVIGNIAGDSAEKALESITEYIVPDLKSYTEDIVFPFVEPPSLEEITAQIDAMGNPEELYATQYHTYMHLKKIQDMLKSGDEFPKGRPHRETVISLGDLALVPVPFEAFSEIAMNLREKSPYKQTVMLGLSSGTCSYLPSEEQIPYGGYEVSMFKSSQLLSFIDGLDKYLVNVSVELLEKLKQN